METKQKQNLQGKRGFTLIELMIAIVIMATLAALIIPKIMSNSRSAQMSATIQSDVKSINTAVGEWRTESSNSDGTYNNIDVKGICSYLPDNMACDDTWIYSGGYKGSDGKGMIKYKIASYKKNTAGDSYKIYMDGSTLAGAQSWSDRAKTNIETTFDNIAKKASSNPAVTIDTVATDIGDPNKDFTNGGSATDAESGVKGITQ